MKYKISLNDEDYLRFNIFYASHSKAGKHSINMARMVSPIVSITFMIIFFISGVKYELIVTEAIVLTIVSIIWCIYIPKRMEKSIRKNIDKIKADGKLPFHTDAEIEFQDFMIVERSEQGEIHVNYKDIEHIYPEKDYLYIFYSAVQAFIVPYHCLGEDKEQVIEYIIKKRS